MQSHLTNTFIYNPKPYMCTHKRGSKINMHAIYTYTSVYNGSLKILVYLFME